MEIEDYKPNSQNLKPNSTLNQDPVPSEKKRMEKIVSGAVVQKKPSFRRTFSEVFLAEDIENVKDYIVRDILLPKARDYLHDSLNGIIDSIFGRRTTDTSTRTPGTSYYYRTSYDKVGQKSAFSPVQPYRESGGTYDFENVVLPNRGEAELVMETLDDIIKEYGLVSVLDYYDLVGIPTKSTDDKYGWKNLSNVKIERVREGYLINMPRAIPLN